MLRYCPCILGLALLFSSCGNNSPEKKDTLVTKQTPADTLPDTTARASRDTEKAPELVPPEIRDSFFSFMDPDNGQYGFENRHHKKVIRAKFEAVGDFINGKAPAVLGDESGFCDTTGKFTALKGYSFTSLDYEPTGETFLDGIGEGLITVKNKAGLFGFVNYKGELVIACLYQEAKGFANGLSPAKKNGKFGYIDAKGETFIDFQYEDAYNFYENRAQVKIKSKAGFINKKGELVIPAVYGEAYFFSEGLCCVTKSDHYENYFFIDSTGKTMIKGPFERAESFKEGKALVEKDGKCMEINTSGKKLRSLHYPCLGGC